MVRDLEARGWVLRSPKPGDDRAIAISLTQTGRSTLHDMDLEARRINTTIERALSADEIDLLNELLRRCTLEVESELRTSYPADAY
jgi:DNA-binding MarR family transcriptional regulator